MAPEKGLWIKNKEKELFMKEGILTEGGVYGHMSHPFDTDINLTFGQLKDIVNRDSKVHLNSQERKLMVKISNFMERWKISSRETKDT